MKGRERRRGEALRQEANMVDPIRSNSVPAGNVPTPRPVSAKPAAQPEAVPVTTSPAKEDTVELSYAAHAQLLRQQGLSIPEIALKLGQDVKTVTGYFPLSG